MLYSCEKENFRGQASRAVILFLMLITQLDYYCRQKRNTYVVSDYSDIILFLLKFILIKICLKQSMFIVQIQNYS